MKKTLIFLSIIALGSIASPPRLASAAIKDDDTTWWSVSEMIEFARRVDTEREEYCHGDIDCERDYLFNMQEQDAKYRALENFLQGQIWLTSINPSKETIKVLFFDEDMMQKNLGITEKLSLNHVYYGWFDSWSGQIYNYNHEQFTNGSMEGIHTIYDGSAEINGENWIPAWQEVELSAAGSNLAANTSGVIGYAAFADSFNAQGQIDYSSCLKANDYEEGEECKLMFSADKWVAYYPPRAEIELDESSPQEGISGNTESGTNTGSDELSGSGSSLDIESDNNTNTGEGDSNNHTGDDSGTAHADSSSDNTNHGTEGGEGGSAWTHGDEGSDEGSGSSSNSNTPEQAQEPTDSETVNSGPGVVSAPSDHANTTITVPSIQASSAPNPINNQVINNYIQAPQPLTGHQNAQIASTTYPYRASNNNRSNVVRATKNSQSKTNTIKPTSQSENNASKSQKSSVESSQEPVINLPSAGELKNNCERIVNFPWWLMVLLVIGDLLVLWFVWPTKKEGKMSRQM